MNSKGFVAGGIIVLVFVIIVIMIAAASIVTCHKEISSGKYQEIHEIIKLTESTAVREKIKNALSDGIITINEYEDILKLEKQSVKQEQKSQINKQLYNQSPWSTQ